MGALDFIKPDPLDAILGILGAATGTGLPVAGILAGKKAVSGIQSLSKPKSRAVNKTNLDKASPVEPAPAPGAELPKPTSQFDPMLNQVKFAQSIQPFLQAMLQQATTGMASSVQGINQAADQYKGNMDQVLSNPSLPENIKSMLGAGVPSTVQTTKNVGTALAASGAATPSYELLINAIKAMQAQEQANQQQVLDLQKQLMLSQWAAQNQPASNNLSKFDALIPQPGK